MLGVVEEAPALGRERSQLTVHSAFLRLSPCRPWCSVQEARVAISASGQMWAQGRGVGDGHSPRRRNVEADPEDTDWDLPSFSKYWLFELHVCHFFFSSHALRLIFLLISQIRSPRPERLGDSQPLPSLSR